MNRIAIAAVLIGASAASGASAQSMMQRESIAEDACVQHVMTQAQNAGYDVSKDEITVTPGTNPEDGPATVRADVEVSAETVTASGMCSVEVGRARQGYINRVDLTFEPTG